MSRGLMTNRQWRKVVDTNRRHRECVAAGTHPTPTGRIEHRTLAGHDVVMDRCGGCDVLYPADRS